MNDAPSQPPDKESESQEIAPTPFDGPFFLPLVLFGLALWFGYDGWLNEDPKMQQHGTFNRVGALLLGAGAAWTLFRALRERKRAARGGS